MSKFDATDMRKNLEELFSNSYVSVEQDGDTVIVNCAELGALKCRNKIEDAFDGSNGLVDSLVDKVIGADVVVYEDFDIDEVDGSTLELYEK